MTLKKRFFTLILFMLTISFLAAEQRAKPLNYKELTTPGSPSYVPIPYPKNREEVIQDLIYFIKEDSKASEVIKYSRVDYETPPTDIIMLDLLKPDSQYKIGKVFTVKNRMPYMSRDYYWLIMVEDSKRRVIMRIFLSSEGLYGGSGAITDDAIQRADPELKYKYERFMKPINAAGVKSRLALSLGYEILDQDIVKMEQVAFPCRLSRFEHPIWEIKMKGGNCYYYSEIWDDMYSVQKKIPWKKDAKGLRPDLWSLTKAMYYLADMVNDEFLILNILPRKGY